MIKSRRKFIQTSAIGLSSTVLPGLHAGSRRLLPDYAPRAKRVIFLFMSGGPAQLDTFDYKPQSGKKPHRGSAVPFKQYGESGHWVSDLLPETARHIDKLCLLKGMTTGTGIHAVEASRLHTGELLRSRPSLGAWVQYALGTENKTLPGFISMNAINPTHYSASFLPAEHSATTIGIDGDDMRTATINNITGNHLPFEVKQDQLSLLQSMNKRHFSKSSQERILADQVSALNLSLEMQRTAPEILDISNENPKTIEKYRVGKQKKGIGLISKQTDFGRQCLLARRFAEAGVRFIQCNHRSWDTHTRHKEGTATNCLATDAPIAALLEDLDQRGMLDETLVVWGGEFGRPGIIPGGKNETGHQNSAFTFWLAGGGVKGGFEFGETNHDGGRVISGKMTFNDLHATILYLMGIEPNNLTYDYGGRTHRLTGPEGGRVIKDIFL